MIYRYMYFADNISLEIAITQTFKERNRGLLALPKIRVDQGLLISPCRSVHTFAMQYPLDLVYLSKQLKVVKLVENLQPNRMSYALAGHSTLELCAGTIERLQIKKDMQITVTDLAPQSLIQRQSDEHEID